MQTLLQATRQVAGSSSTPHPASNEASRPASEPSPKGASTSPGPTRSHEQLAQALKPSAQASALFAIIGGLLGLLLAFNAILLTVPERRQAIADLRLSGTPRGAVAQLVLFQALCLGVAASAVGLGVGYLLARWVFASPPDTSHRHSPSPAPPSFPSRRPVAPPRARVMPLRINRTATRPPSITTADAIYYARHTGRRPIPTDFARSELPLPSPRSPVLYATAPSTALIAAARSPSRPSSPPLSPSLVCSPPRGRFTTDASLSTLALALRAYAAQPSARSRSPPPAPSPSSGPRPRRSPHNLTSGIHAFAHAYASDAPIWVAEPGESGQATGLLVGDGGALELRSLPGVAWVQAFQGTFMTFRDRRVWLIARPPTGATDILASQTIGGPAAAHLAEDRLASGSWVVVSEQIANELHAHVGQPITLPTASGDRATGSPASRRTSRGPQVSSS